jgi:uncharacterized protein (DUF1800 family)
VQAAPLEFPYREAGLTPEQASAHLLNRLTYGPRPGQVEAVASQGLEEWWQEQLRQPAVPLRNDRQLVEDKLRRAVVAPDQVREVMCEFWFNHFNVSLTDDDCARYVPSYEAVAIYPNALGNMEQLLKATSHHPAMLYYLDNAYSQWSVYSNQTKVDRSQDPFGYHGRKPKMVPVEPSNRQGLNENYARELLELHTLGVDGGYRQADVTELARILTGWTVEKETFLFRPEAHDPGAKRFLYTRVEAAGQLEGEKVLLLLAQHSSTARHLARKFAVRFLCDQPPKPLVDRLTRAYLRSRGETRALLEALLTSREFWEPQYIAAKIKSPLELQASAWRTLGSESVPWRGSLAAMGQDLYHCRPPTGWPDRAETWLTPGNLVKRLAFAHEVAQQGDLSKLIPTRSGQGFPDAAAALRAYAQSILPGRDVEPTVALLLEAAKDPAYGKAVIASSKGSATKVPRPKPNQSFHFDRATQVNLVGLLLGCPEFQRR